MTAPYSTAQQPDSYPQGTIPLPPGATEIWLVRHGQSQAYVPGEPFPLVAGHGDPPLTEYGHRQAELVGARLADVKLDAIYVTTLTRTAQTAAPLAARVGLEPIVEADLREVYLGQWDDGSYRQMMAQGHPIARQVMTEQRWGAIPGAEADDAFAARVRGAVMRLAAAHRDQRIAAFSHGGVIAAILSSATGSRPFAFLGADNASVSRLYVMGEHWMVRSFNETAHLDE
ncbi:MAG: histidine phosphatase family protein [Streptosporangiaceae bacterium]